MFGIYHTCFVIRKIVRFMYWIPVVVNRYPVQKFSTVFQKIDIPFHICQSCCCEFCLRIYMLYHFSSLFHKTSPFLSRFCTDFPETIIFVSNAPIFYFIWIWMPIGNSPLCIFSFPIQITVFYPVAHFFCCTGSCICTDVWFTADFLTHRYILICSK